MSTDKPDWMTEHEEEDKRAFKAILEKLESIERKIDPVVEAYRAATLLGKWAKGGVAFILACLAIWATLKTISH